MMLLTEDKQAALELLCDWEDFGCSVDISGLGSKNAVWLDSLLSRSTALLYNVKPREEYMRPE